MSSDERRGDRLDRTAIGCGDLVYRTPQVPIFTRSENVFLEDADGFRYLDGEAAGATAGLGFDPALVTEVAVSAMELPGLPSFAESRRRLDVASRLARMLAPAAGCHGRVAFELGGAQAIELALRIVFSNTTARTLVVFEGAYHGRSAAAGQLSSSARYRRLLNCNLDVVRLPYPDCRRCVTGSSAPGCADECLRRIRRYGVDDMAGAPTGRGIAAVILEPLLNVGGMALPDSKLVQHVVNHFRNLGAYIIIDEVFTGLHRLGPRWGFELHGVRPDIVVGAKAMTNGLAALSFVWARDPLLSIGNFPPGSHSSTFSGNPFALAAADIVLSRYEQDGAAMAMRADSFRQIVSTLHGAPHVSSVDTTGWVARIVLDLPQASLVRERALIAGRSAPIDGIHGLLLSTTGLAPDVVALHPALVMSPEQASTAVALLRRALDAA